MQLFSIPQQMQANSTNREPVLKARLETSLKDKRAQEAVTKRIPSHSLGDMDSLKNTRAISAVATISKFFLQNKMFDNEQYVL